jgi:hypothetical protein
VSGAALIAPHLAGVIRHLPHGQPILQRMLPASPAQGLNNCSIL